MCGTQSEPILKALLSKTDLTLDKALEQARMEAAAKKTEELQGTHCHNSAVHLAGRAVQNLVVTWAKKPQ